MRDRGCGAEEEDGGEEEENGFACPAAVAAPRVAGKSGDGGHDCVVGCLLVSWKEVIGRSEARRIVLVLVPVVGYVDRVLAQRKSLVQSLMIRSHAASCVRRFLCPLSCSSTQDEFIRWWEKALHVGLDD